MRLIIGGLLKTEVRSAMIVKQSMLEHRVNQTKLMFLTDSSLLISKALNTQ